MYLFKWVFDQNARRSAWSMKNLSFCNIELMSVLRRISADVECALFWKHGEADLVWLLMGICQAKNERPGVWPYGKDLLSVGLIKSSFISELVTCQTNCFMVWWQPTIHKSCVYSFLRNLKMFHSLKRSFAIPSPTNPWVNSWLSLCPLTLQAMWPMGLLM